MHDTKDIRKLVRTEGMVGLMEKDGETDSLLETSPSLHVDDTRPSLGLGSRCNNPQYDCGVQTKIKGEKSLAYN
jgi:hypothetical protein